MSRNFSNTSSDNFGDAGNPNGVIKVQWLMITYCDILSRNLIYQGMIAVSPTPSEWLVAKKANLSEKKTIHVLVDYDRSIFIDPHIFDFFGGKAHCAKVHTREAYLAWLQELRHSDPGAKYHKGTSNLNSERYYNHPQDIIDVPSSGEEEKHSSLNRNRSRSRSRSPRSRSRSRSPRSRSRSPRFAQSPFDNVYRAQREQSLPRSAPPASLNRETPLRIGTPANPNSQTPSTSNRNFTSSSPAQVYDRSSYVGPLPPTPEPIINWRPAEGTPEMHQRINSQPNPFMLANGTFNSNRSTSHLKQNTMGAAKKCAKKVSFVDEMGIRPQSNASRENPSASRGSSLQESSNISRNNSDQGPKPAMKVFKSDRNPSNEEKNEIKQSENAVNQSSSQAGQQMIRDFANTTINPPSLSNQELISILMNNENQESAVEWDIRDRNQNNLARIELKLRRIIPNEVEVPSGREDYWECKACKNINSIRIEFCPRCQAHRYG